MAKKPSKRPAKLPQVLEKARRCVDEGLFRITKHADQRMGERRVILPEILKVIRTGYHEQRKDQYKLTHGGWCYAIRGRTIDNRDLRIVLAFERETKMLVITVIDKDLEEEA